MNSEQAVYRRVLRRETHSSRACAAITVAVCATVLVAAGGVGCVLLLAHRPADLVVRNVFAEISDLPQAIRNPTLIAGIVVTVLGAMLLLLGLLPGRKARRQVATPGRTAVVVDDSVVADAIAQHVSSSTELERNQITVTIGRRRADVRIVPISGVPADVDRATSAAVAASAEYGLSSRPRIRIADHGFVG